MRRFLLFISFCFMLLMPLSATEVTVVEDFSTTNIWKDLPNASQSKPGTGSFTSTTTGYTYNASWSTGCYWINKNALLLGKTTGNFIEFPAFEGKVTKVEILNSTECSTKVAVKITDKNGDVIVAAKTFSTKGTTYTYDIPAEKQVEGQVLRLVLNNGNNVQISKITITIEQGEPTGLSFTPNKITINGDEVPEFTFNNPNGVTVTWESSDTKVATVDPEGKVTVTGAGTTVITATGSDGDSAELTLNVNPIAGNISFFATTFVVIKDKDKDAEFVAPVLTNPNGLTVTYTSNSEVAMVDENTGYVVLNSSATGNKATITATAAAQGIYAESTASYTIEVKEAGAGSGTSSFSEKLTTASFAATGNTYVSGTKTYNDIEYTFNTAITQSGNNIQLRSKKGSDDSYSGIIVTANKNGYVLRKVTVEWATESTSGTLDVYGKNTAYTGENAAQLYAAATQGTQIGSIVYGKSTTLDITEDYQFIGLRSKSGAMYITSITLEWEGAAAGAPTFSATLSISTATEGGESANVLSLNDINGTVDLAGKNVYLNDRNICGADASATYLPYLADGVFTVVDGTTAYALNATLPNLSSIAAKVTKVAYKAWKDNDHLISEGMWYLDAEYTVAADTEMELVADFYFEGNAGREGHVKSVTGNTAYVEGIGYFTVTSTTGSDGKTHDVYEYITDAAGDFMVTPQFPFFVKSGMSDMIKAPEGTSRVVAINGTVAMVEVDKLAEQPSAEGGNVSGVESVVVDSEGAVEYYNLQGVRVDGALTPGIYIRRSGNTATKISIR